jgi:hypothetical protein
VREQAQCGHQQRGLARADAAEDDNPLPFMHLEIDSAQHDGERDACVVPGERAPIDGYREPDPEDEQIDRRQASAEAAQRQVGACGEHQCAHGGVDQPDGNLGGAQQGDEAERDSRQQHDHERCETDLV